MNDLGKVDALVSLRRVEPDWYLYWTEGGRQYSFNCKQDALSPFSTIHAIQLEGNSVNDELLRKLIVFKNLEYLILDNTNTTQDGITYLEYFPKLQTLWLNGTKIMDVSVLRKLSHLYELELNNTKVGDDCLKSLTCHNSLKFLSLNGTKISDDALKSIGEFKELSGLSLRQTNVSDGCLQFIKELPKLVSLDLAGTGISDEGLRNLKSIPKLITLDLSGTQVTVQGLRVFAEHTNLDRIVIEGIKTTDKEIEQLKEEVPSLKRVWITRNQ